MSHPLISLRLVSRPKPPGDRVSLYGELAALGRFLRYHVCSSHTKSRFSRNKGFGQGQEMTFTVVH